MGFERKKYPTPPTRLHIPSKRPSPIIDPNGIPNIMGTMAAIEHDDRKLANPWKAVGNIRYPCFSVHLNGNVISWSSAQSILEIPTSIKLDVIIHGKHRRSELASISYTLHKKTFLRRYVMYFFLYQVQKEPFRKTVVAH